jgi:hypothetical protein
MLSNGERVSDRIGFSFRGHDNVEVVVAQLFGVAAYLGCVPERVRSGHVGPHKAHGMRLPAIADGWTVGLLVRLGVHVDPRIMLEACVFKSSHSEGGSQCVEVAWLEEGMISRYEAASLLTQRL